jgi:hypothetical protein
MWSQSLQEQTREFFRRYPFAFVKHFGDFRFGVCSLMDGRCIVRELPFHDRQGPLREWEYPSVDGLIEAGWAID